MKIIVVLASRSFIYYVINVYVPRVRANAYQALTTPPRVFRDPKMCLRNIWTAPYILISFLFQLPPLLVMAEVVDDDDVGPSLVNPASPPHPSAATLLSPSHHPV